MAGIKPLEWRYYPNAFPPSWDAATPFGRYSIEKAAQDPEEGYPITGEFSFVVTFGAEMRGSRIALDAAQAFAQADYEQRILAALEPSPPTEAEGEWVLSYAQIIAIVDDCSERMKKAGEGHRMFAKWVSEGISAAIASRPATIPTARAEAVE